MRKFIGVDLERRLAPLEAMNSNFRRRSEAGECSLEILAAFDAYSAERGIKLGTDTIADATIISAPNVSKDRNSYRDPRMRPVGAGSAAHRSEGAQRCAQPPQVHSSGGGDCGQRARLPSVAQMAS